MIDTVHSGSGSFLFLGHPIVSDTRETKRDKQDHQDKRDIWDKRGKTKVKRVTSKRRKTMPPDIFIIYSFFSSLWNVDWSWWQLFCRFERGLWEEFAWHHQRLAQKSNQRNQMNWWNLLQNLMNIWLKNFIRYIHWGAALIFIPSESGSCFLHKFPYWCLRKKLLFTSMGELRLGVTDN